MGRIIFTDGTVIDTVGARMGHTHTRYPLPCYVKIAGVVEGVQSIRTPSSARMLVAALVSPFDRCCRDDIRISALLTLPHHHGFIVDFPEMHGTVRYLSMDDYAALKAATFDS